MIAEWLKQDLSEVARWLTAFSLIPLWGCLGGGISYTAFATVSGERPLAAATERLRVTARVGNVLVSPSSEGPVKIEAEVRVRAGQVEVEKASKAFEDHVRISERDGVLTIEDAHRDAPDREDWSVTLRVSVPRALSVSAETDVGNVEVSTASGDLKAKTGAGEVRISVGDLVSAKATSGVGNVEVKAGRVQGDLEASSGVGDVIVKVAAVEGKAEAETGTGDVDAAFTDSAPRGDFSATCGVGNVKATLPANVAAEFSAKTGVGQLSVDGLAGVNVSESITGATAAGTVGKGGPHYTVTCGTGNVTVRTEK